MGKLASKTRILKRNIKAVKRVQQVACTGKQNRVQCKNERNNDFISG